MDEGLGGPWIAGLLSAAFIAVGAAFSFVEAALNAFGVARAQAEVETDPSTRDAKTAKRWLADREAIRLRFLTGRVLCIVASAALAIRTAVSLSWSLALSAAIGVGVVILYSAAAGIASALAPTWGPKVALPTLRYLRPLELLITPIAAPVTKLAPIVLRAFGAPTEPATSRDGSRVVELEVEQAIARGEKTGSIAPEHAELIRGVLEFQDTKARDVMVPRTETVAIEIDTPIEKAFELVVEAGHSRYPVYRERIDRVIGILFAKDLLRAALGRAPGLKLADVIKVPALFVPATQKISDTLQQMRSRRAHLAVVVDEYGGTAGILTLEDILEEIVGDIDDEHDSPETASHKIGDGRYLVDASMSIYDFEELVGLKLADDEAGYRSLAGYVVDRAGRVPAVGEEVALRGVRVIVRDADRRRVRRLEIVRTKTASQSHGGGGDPPQA